MKTTALLSFAIMLLTTSCDEMLIGTDEPIASLEQNLESPPLLDDGWEVSDLSAQRINPTGIQNLIKSIQANPKNIHSLLIIRNGKLVSESYFDGWNRQRLHALRSDSKSFISTLMGIAIDKGYIKNVHQKVFDFFPEYSDLRNEQKNQIEIRHILTMSPGFQWDEFTYFNQDDYRNDAYAIERSDDRLRYLLKKEIVDPVGSYFLYNSALPTLQSAIIRKSTGETIDVFAARNLFGPLNITNYFLRMNQDGYAAGAPLFLTPRDMAKLGQIFLDGGRWKDKQIVSAEWVAAASSSIMTSTSSFTASRPGTGYGYNWWTEKFTIRNSVIQTFAAEGNGGQYIFVVPELNAVVVFTGGNYESNQDAPFGMMTNFILPAMM
jgi:CubicO group peptidase (beta-lactamase class C family)